LPRISPRRDNRIARQAPLRTPPPQWPEPGVQAIEQRVWRQEFERSRSNFMSKVEWSFFVVLAMSLILAATPAVADSQEHVVTPTELHKDMARPTQQRQMNEERLEQFLSTPVAREAMRRTNVDYSTVEKGIRMLNDAEVARLRARADQAQADFAAGGISGPELLLIAIAVLVIIIVVVKA
jgi:hypothetical protein